MKIQEPIPHWSNFTVPELKQILEHCEALDRLGIAQDEEMVVSIRRDITLRENRYVHSELKLAKIGHQTVKQDLRKTNKNIGMTVQHAKQKQQDYLLEQTI